MPRIQHPRPTWDSYFLEVAYSIAARADCTRRLVGAVLVDSATHYIIATGYNGAAPHEPGCLTDGACPRGRHYQTTTEPYPICKCGNKWPCPDGAMPNSSYDTGLNTCIAIHAEANALLRSGTRSQGAIMYITGEPCDGCVKLMKGAQIWKTVWPGGIMIISPGEEWIDG